MRLLILTQKVDRDDPILGFFHRWLVEFAKHCESVIVICLEKGEHELPANVRVLSLGKEEGRTENGERREGSEGRSREAGGRRGQTNRLQYARRFYSYIRKERENYDAVFVHMNPIYVVLGSVLWKSWGKRIGLWYTHRNVDMKLRIAEKMSDFIVTASPESFRLKSSKVNVIGHGIDTDAYSEVISQVKNDTDPVTILHVGRITRIKNCDILIEAVGLLKKTWNRQVKASFIGEPVTHDDQAYKKELEALIEKNDLQSTIIFAGSVANPLMPERYSQASLTVNLTPTGGVDKAVLESLASGTPVFFSNETFLDLFDPYSATFHISYRDPEALAEKIRDYFLRADRHDIQAMLRERVLAKYSVASLVSRILSYYP